LSALRLELSPSPVLAALIGGAAALAVVPGPAGVLLGCALLALGSAAAWSRALLRAKNSVRTLELDGAVLTVGLASGARLPAEVGERRYVSRLLVTLPLRAEARRTLLVSRDMLGAGAFRALRLWALWGKLPAVAAKQLPG
jgi:hypothetical protein